ncbi:hypothetical protein Fraau_1155 [Frateuria aurantia DSM 6220]|uniref:Uncharacterized protein n=1 Tax=Frateuria aurantia (strain ATCC 33424 / DSM 6220 / KCTC 2777 / LMG 1558 / NBRC 3245 / NCIMB 13370) TaxID=767434 RepID=H8L420_FRAAD|nr:hypothetical protein Fraau_1155 [Frateuria aurantia DSM 6220]
MASSWAGWSWTLFRMAASAMLRCIVVSNLVCGILQHFQQAPMLKSICLQGRVTPC